MWQKMGGSIGSAPSDPVKDQAALAPIPPPAIENKPAPGQTGPKGMSPRTTYSRVNAGSPPVMDAGATSQKNGPIRGMEFLPAKVAGQRGFMTTMHERPTLQSMVKAAMEATTGRLQVNLEAARATGVQTSAVKTASAKTDSNSVSTEDCTKLASALGFIRQEIVKSASDVMPGTGPNALPVSEARDGSPPLEPGQSGQATSQNQPPKDPPLQADKVQSGNSGTGLETNDSMMHPEQPLEPIKNASALGKAFAVRDAAKGAAGKAGKFVKEHPKAVGAGVAAVGGASAAAALKGKKKEGSAPISLLRKLAEDAINPAHISSSASVNPAEPPPGASASGEDVPSEPADVNSQKRLISSNEAAINYTKREAKADPKKDVNQVLSEPALSAAHDSVLQKTLEHTNEAGAKIASNNMKKIAAQVGAQRVMLSKLLEKAASETKGAAK